VYRRPRWPNEPGLDVQTREQKLTDHAAVTLGLGVGRVAPLETGDPTADDALTLF